MVAPRLAEIGKLVAKRAKSHGLSVVFRQSNHEGELVDWIQEARVKAAGLIINAGAYTHTSLALHDALRALDKPDGRGPSLQPLRAREVPPPFAKSVRSPTA